MDAIKVFPDKAGGWRFHVKAQNGEIIATSESYTRRADAERGVETLGRVMQETFEIAEKSVRSFLENDLLMIQKLLAEDPDDTGLHVIKMYVVTRLRVLHTEGAEVIIKGGDGRDAG